MTSSVLCVICRKNIENGASDKNKSQLLLLKAYNDNKRRIDDEKRGIDFSSDSIPEQGEREPNTFDAVRGKPVTNAVSVCSQHANHFMCLNPCALNYLAAAVTDRCPVCRATFCDAAQTIFDAFVNKRLYQNLASHVQVARQQYRELIAQQNKTLTNRLCQKDLELHKKQQQERKKEATASEKPHPADGLSISILPPNANVKESFQMLVDFTADSITWTRKDDGASLTSQMRVFSKQWPLQITSTDLQILCRNMLSLQLSKPIQVEKVVPAKTGSDGTICLSYEMIQMLCRANCSRLSQEIDFVFRVPPMFELLSLAPLSSL